jgi:hypothetical protein
MSYIYSFAPSYNTNIVATPAATSASVAISPHDLCVRLVNSGVNICFVKVTENADTATATTADLPILPGSSIIIRKSFGYKRLAHISALGTTLHIQTGDGGA